MKTVWTESTNGIWTAELPGEGETKVALQITRVSDVAFEALVNNTKVATRNSLPRAQNSARYFGTHLSEIKETKTRTRKTPTADVIAEGGSGPVALPPAPPTLQPKVDGPVIEFLCPGAASDNGISWPAFDEGELTVEWQKAGTGRVAKISGQTESMIKLRDMMKAKLPEITGAEYGKPAGDIRKAIRTALERLCEALGNPPGCDEKSGETNADDETEDESGE